MEMLLFIKLWQIQIVHGSSCIGIRCKIQWNYINKIFVVKVSQIWVNFCAEICGNICCSLGLAHILALNCFC